MGKPILHTEELKAFLDGEAVEMSLLSALQEHWFPFNAGNCHLDMFNDPRYDCRIKPRTININGFEVPEPFRGELGVLQEYFIVLIDVDVMRTRITAACNNSNLEVGRKYVALGIVHLTEEAAELHARALLSFTAKQGE